MGNRKQPFGYRMTLGEITILPEEAELVRFIFRCYSTGATLGDLTKALCRQEIPYYEGRSWNKNMVSRILEDGRYIGEKGYPALIEPEQLRTAAKKRTARARPPQKTPAQKALRHTALRAGGEDRHRPAQRAHTLPRPYSASGIPSGRRCLRENAGGADLRTGATAHR